jgi:3-deoxy-D-manno-octulosonic-acid transferase/heptosyltransferase-1
LILVEHLGVARGPVDYQFPHDALVEADVDRFLAEVGVSGGQALVVLHPVARWATKLWFNDRFAALADALQAQGVRTVFSGGPQDAPVLGAIEDQMQTPCLRFDGCGGLRHLAALCRRADVMVSTDTGPMHLAAAVGTPVVALFGPTAPNRTGPYGSGHHVIQASVPCSPCFKRRCTSTVVEEFGCMKWIEVSRVLQAVQDCLKRRPASRDPSPPQVINNEGSHAPA